MTWINVNDALPTHEDPVIICEVDEGTGEKSSGFGRYQRERSRKFMRTFWMDRYDCDIDGPVTPMHLVRSILRKFIQRTKGSGQAPLHELDGS